MCKRAVPSLTAMHDLVHQSLIILQCPAENEQLDFPGLSVPWAGTTENTEFSDPLALPPPIYHIYTSWGRRLEDASLGRLKSCRRENCKCWQRNPLVKKPCPEPEFSKQHFSVSPSHRSNCTDQRTPGKQNQLSVFVYKEMTFNEVAHTLMEVGKSQDLQGELANWKPKRTNGVVLAWVRRPENRENQWHSSQPKGPSVSSRPRKSKCFSWDPKAAKNSLLLVGKSSHFVLFTFSTNFIEKACNNSPDWRTTSLDIECPSSSLPKE